MSFTWRNGRWLSTTTLNDGAKVTDYYYDSNNNLIAEKTDSTTFFYYDTYNRLVETIV